MAQRTMVVKVQKALASTEDELPWLVYDKTRKKVHSLIPDSKIPDDVKTAMGDDIKAFFKVTLKGIHIDFKGRVASQNW